jgi:integrase
MSAALALVTEHLPDQPDAEMLHHHERAKAQRRHSRAASTQRTYAQDFKLFALWCASGGRDYPSLPAPTLIVAWHLNACCEGWTAGTRQYRPLSVSSINRRLAAIAWVHRTNGHADPTDNPALREQLSGIRNLYGRPPRRKQAATAERIALMLAKCPDNLLGIRDRCLLALGFAGAFRRSELAALRVEDLTRVPEGLRITITRSKTDQTAQGQEIVVPHGSSLLPVRAVEEWLAASGIAEGLLLRVVHRGGHLKHGGLTGHDVARAVKKYAQAAGLDPAEFSGHSLRAGFATSAAETGASVLKIMETTRHKSVDVLAAYVRRVDLFKDHAGAKFL